jgi:hypothetical protein
VNKEEAFFSGINVFEAFVGGVVSCVRVCIASCIK